MCRTQINGCDHADVFGTACDQWYIERDAGVMIKAASFSYRVVTRVYIRMTDIHSNAEYMYNRMTNIHSE